MSKQVVWPSIWGTKAEVNDDGEVITGSSPLPIVCLTGDYGTGKTLFGYRVIARPAGSDEVPLYVFDYEGGSLAYKQDYACSHQDLRGMTQLEIYEHFDYAIMSMRPGQYAAVIIDTAEFLDDAFKAYVLANPGKFGKTSAQYNGGSGGLFWGDVKLHMRRKLSGLSSKVQTVFVIHHLRQQFNGNTPVKGKFEPKGLDIWEQFAALYAWLIPGTKGKGIGAPSAVLTKRRVVFNDWNDTDNFGVPAMKPLLPRFMQTFDATTLRDYMMNPRTKFSDKEMQDIDPSTVAFSDDERLSMQTQIAQTEGEKLRREAENALNDGKRRLAKELIGQYGYSANEEEFRQQIQRAMAAKNISYSVAEHDAVRNQLIHYAESQLADSPSE